MAQELFSESIGDLSMWKEGPPFPQWVGLGLLISHLSPCTLFIGLG